MTHKKATEILGISHLCTVKEIKTAMRAKVQELHPDKGGNAQAFNEVMTAYKYLTTTKKNRLIGDSYSSFNFRMADPPKENTITKKLVGCMKANDALVWKIHGHGMQMPGIPDLYVASIFPSLNCWLEIKVEENKPTTLQKRILTELYGAGVLGLVIRHHAGNIYIEDREGQVLEFLENFEFDKIGGYGLLEKLSKYYLEMAQE